MLSGTLVVAVSSNPLQSAVDFFKSPLWSFFTKFALLFVAALWLAGAYWVFKDARRRIDDKIILVVLALAGLVFGPFAVLIYVIVRPAEFLEDCRERELEIEVLQQRLDEFASCPACGMSLRDDYLLCPRCGRQHRTPCVRCHRPIDGAWRVCPYCETDQRSGAAQF